MKWIRKLFILAVMAILVTGLLRTVFLPKELNSYENRYANQLPALSWSSYLEGIYQEAVEDSLEDQVPFGQVMKRLYNQNHARYVKGALDGVTGLLGLEKNRYVRFGSLQLYGDDYIVNWTQTLSQDQEKLDRKIAVLNETFARHPELNFFVYYIEKDTDIDFETGEKSGLSDYLLQGLNLPETRKGTFSVDSYEDFAEKFYRTDTHWNCVGSYEGYLQLCSLLDCDGTPLVPTGEAVLLGDTFSGVKAFYVGATGVLTESFFAYPYDFPAMTVTIDGAPAEDYGSQTAFFTGQEQTNLSYGTFYGEDNGETVLSTGTQGRGNILVIGESFDNAILKLLASHYDNLYSVDLRYYEHSMGTAFDFSAYTAEHEISNVLLIGNIDYFLQDTFDPEG